MFVYHRYIHKTMSFSTPFMERENCSSKFYAQMNLLIGGKLKL